MPQDKEEPKWDLNKIHIGVDADNPEKEIALLTPQQLYDSVEQSMGASRKVLGEEAFEHATDIAHKIGKHICKKYEGEPCNVLEVAVLGVWMAIFDMLRDYNATVDAGIPTTGEETVQ